MSNRKLAKNTMVLGLSTVINKGLMFIMVPIFTRWLSVEDFGTYDLLATYVSLLIPIITVASSNAVFRLSVDKKENEQKLIIANGLYLVVGNLFISIVLLCIFNRLLHFSTFFPFLIMLVSEVFDNYFQGYLRAIKKLSILGLCKTLTTISIAALITLFVRYLGLGLEGLIFGYSFGFALDCVLIIFITKYWKYVLNIELSKDKIKEIVAYSWALVPNDICWWIINVSDRQIINVFLGAAANGIYAVAYKVPNLCSSVFGVFNISWQEEATDSLLYENKTEYYNGVLNTVLRLLLSLCIGIIACNFILFDYIFDERFSDARLYTPILISSIIFYTVAIFYGGIQISLKRPKANGFSTLIGAVSNLIVHISLVNYIGLYAAALSTLVSNIVVMYIRKYMLRNEYKFIIQKRQYILGLVFIYFSIMGTMKLPIIVNIIDLIMAATLFMIINKNIIKAIFEKL